MDLLRFVGLAENPHELAYDGLGRHVKGLQDLWAASDLVADLIHAHIAALVLHLCGEHDRLARVHRTFEDAEKIAAVIAGDAADAKRLKNQRVISLEHERGQFCLCAGDEL